MRNRRAPVYDEFLSHRERGRLFTFRRFLSGRIARIEDLFRRPIHVVIPHELRLDFRLNVVDGNLDVICLNGGEHKRVFRRDPVAEVNLLDDYAINHLASSSFLL